MKSAIIFYFENGAPIDCKLACDTDQQQAQLYDRAQVMLAALDGIRAACTCGKTCPQASQDAAG